MYLPRVVHFEIDAEKPERLVNFYEKVFGWKLMKWEGPMDYWLITTGKEGEPGIDGGLGKRTEPGPHTVNTIDVPSVDEFVKKVEANGGTIVVSKHAVPGVGWLAYFKDPEGNMFGMMQSDESAK
jgi:predicted enzyme related to lactoylglutathione lyase